MKFRGICLLTYNIPREYYGEKEILKLFKMEFPRLGVEREVLQYITGVGATDIDYVLLSWLFFNS